MLVPQINARGPILAISLSLAAALTSFHDWRVSTVPWGRHNEDERILTKVLSRIADVFRVRRSLHETSVSILWIQTSGDRRAMFRDLLLLLSTRKLYQRVVLQVHGSEAGRLLQPGSLAIKFLARLLLRMVDGVLLLSTEEVNLMKRFVPGARIFFVVNPYTAGQLCPEGAGAMEASPTILFVGRIMRRKGVFDLVEAFGQLDPGLNARLTIAGEGPDMRTLERAVNAHPQSKQINLAGYKTGCDLARLYRSAAIFALPTYWNEGFPTVLTEAMEYGLPIVTTRTRGAVDHLRDGLNALYVSPHEPAALMSVLNRLLRDHDLRNRMSAANRRHIQNFAPAIVAPLFANVLTQIVASK